MLNTAKPVWIAGFHCTYYRRSAVLIKLNQSNICHSIWDAMMQRAPVGCDAIIS